MTKILAPVVVASILLNACGGGSDAQKTAAVLKGDDKAATADNAQCKLFTPADVAKYIGERVSSGENAAMGAGCQWVALDGSGDVIVAVVPSQYHERPSGAKGFKEVPDVGSKGFVAPQLDGWVAGAIEGDRAVRVSVAGAAASEASAIALLKDSIKRLGL